MAISRAILIAVSGSAALLAGCTPVNEADQSLIGQLRIFGSMPAFAGAKNVGPPSPEAVKVARRIAQGVGIRPNFKILAADVRDGATAFATIRNGKRYIVYDRKMLRLKNGSANWRDLFIVAHEIGHHLGSHVYVSEYSDHEQELEADRFAAFALGKLGASREQATSWFADWPASKTHPSGARRRKEAAQGWEDAQRLKRLETGSCKSGWVGDKLDIEGAMCRIAQACARGEQATRLACQDYDGVWRWRP